MPLFTFSDSWTIQATPNEIFLALTEPSALKTWFAEDVQIEPRVNGVYRFWGRHTLGTPPHDAARQTLTRFEPNSAIAFLWPINDVDTDVTIELEAAANGTRLTLTHDISGDIAMPHPRELIDEHWRIAIGNLATHLAGGRPRLPDYFNPR